MAQTLGRGCGTRCAESGGPKHQPGDDQGADDEYHPPARRPCQVEMLDLSSSDTTKGHPMVDLLAPVVTLENVELLPVESFPAAVGAVASQGPIEPTYCRAAEPR